MALSNMERADIRCLLSQRRHYTEEEMRPYFEEMIAFGRPLSDKEKEDTKQNVEKIKEVEKELAEELEAVKKCRYSC